MMVIIEAVVSSGFCKKGFLWFKYLILYESSIHRITQKTS